MKIFTIITQRVLVLSWLLLFPVASRCSEKIAIYGVDVSSGESVLATVDLPDSFFDSKESKVVELQPQIISRGAYFPSSVSNGSLLFWKGATLWKFESDKYFALFDARIGTTQNTSQAVESSGELFGSSVLAVSMPSGENTLSTSILAKHGFRFKPEADIRNQKISESNIPVSWIGDRHLVTLRSETDLIGRLTQSEFFLNVLENKKEEDTNYVAVSSSQKLTSLPSTSLELLLSVFSNTAAIQIFDQTTKEFKIGIFDIQKQSLLYWIPNPTTINGKLIGIEKRRALRLAWSPSGGNLAVSYSKATLIWNMENRKWQTSTTANVPQTVVNQEGFLWIDDDQVLTYNFSDYGGSITGDVIFKRLSTSNQNPISVGIMKNLSIRQVFLLRPGVT